jgi:hypothetical protein
VEELNRSDICSALLLELATKEQVAVIFWARPWSNCQSSGSPVICQLARSGYDEGVRRGGAHEFRVERIIFRA